MEKEETNLVIQIMDFLTKEKAPVSFYDIGANTGYYGILTAYKYRSSVKVNSFEPIQKHIDYLEKSVYLNRLENSITIHRLALGNENKMEKIYVAGSGTSLNKDFIEENFEFVTETEVKN